MLIKTVKNAKVRIGKQIDTFNSSTGWFEIILTLLAILLVITLFTCLIAISLLWPLAVLWAINQIFGTQIPITFGTWLASVILLTVLNSRVTIRTKRK